MASEPGLSRLSPDPTYGRKLPHRHVAIFRESVIPPRIQTSTARRTGTRTEGGSRLWTRTPQGQGGRSRALSWSPGQQGPGPSADVDKWRLGRRCGRPRADPRSRGDRLPWTGRRGPRDLRPPPRVRLYSPSSSYCNAVLGSAGCWLRSVYVETCRLHLDLPSAFFLPFLENHCY